MNTKELFDKIFQHQQLNSADGIALMQLIANEQINAEQLAGILTALRLQTPSADFLLGVREVALEHASKIQFEYPVLLDVCGTGGDNKNTFNISTASAILLAACGIKVVKHGNYAVSSSCGSSNVLEALGYRFTNESAVLQKELAEHNITFIHAPLFHPVFKKVSAVRKNLGFKTFFNVLGPLVNPASPSHQLVGVSEYAIQKLLAEVLARTDKKFAVVHSLDGFDEISLTSSFTIKSSCGEELIDPRELGISLLSAHDLVAQDNPADNANLIRNIFTRSGTPAQEQVVIANSAAALRLVNPEMSWEEALATTKESLLSGNAAKILKKLVN